MINKLLIFCITVSLLALTACGSPSSLLPSTEDEGGSTETGTTLTSEDFSYTMTPIQPVANADATITIKPTNTSTPFKYRLEATRTSGTGSITYEEFITAGTGLSLGHFSFTGDKVFTLNFSTAEDTYDVGIVVKDSDGTSILSNVTFNVTVQ